MKGDPSPQRASSKGCSTVEHHGGGLMSGTPSSTNCDQHFYTRHKSSAMTHLSPESLESIFAELNGTEHPHLDSLLSQLQDIELQPSVLISLLVTSLSLDTHPLALRKVLTLVSTLDSYEELTDGIHGALVESLSLEQGGGARFGRALLTRMLHASSTQWEVGVAATGSTGSLVGQAKLADAHQPKGGVLGAAVVIAPAPVPAVVSPPAAAAAPTQAPGAHFCAPATRYVSSSRRGAGPPYEELRALRGLLAWAWCHCPLARRGLEREVREVLAGVGCGRVGEGSSYALSALLGFVSALCAAGQGIIFNARTPPSAQGIADTILALFSSSSSSSRGSRGGGLVGFNALQCFLTPFFPQASSLLLSILTSNPALAPKAVDSLLASASSAMLESSTRATTVLQLLQSVVGVGVALEGSGGKDSASISTSTSAPPQFPPSLLPFVLSCAVSDNSAIARTSLSFFSLPSWCTWVVMGGGLSKAVHALLKGGALTPHWNATVNKFTRSALEALEEAAGKEGGFKLAIESIIPPSSVVSLPPSPSPPPATTSAAPPLQPTPAAPPSVTTAPPLPAAKGLVTGRPLVNLNPPPPSSMTWKGASSGQPPPLTITGIAPWAMAKRVTPPVSSVSTSSGGGTPLAPPPTTTPSSPFERYQWYLDTLVPPSPLPPSPSSSIAALEGGMGSSLPPPLSPSPMLLPHLSFHDLVWGEDLGSGTYCTVTAARHILKGVPQRQWPLYAVKKVSAEALHTGNVYRGAVARELTVLSLLTHPATSRLVCAYRWRGGLHMVQEHAGVTDLHRYIELAGQEGGGGGVGGVKEEEARWIIGEVGAALGYMHSIGFAYGDCKPENVVLWVGEEAERLTKLGEGGGGRGLHCKLVDFAACRPLQGGGGELLQAQAQLLQGVRDGEWKKPGGSSSSSSASGGGGGGGDSLDLAQEVDDRIEGTLEYLAPELCGGEGVGGGYPTIASDAYALGVTLYQLLAGGKFPDTMKMWGECGGVRDAQALPQRRVGGGGVGFSSHIRVMGGEEEGEERGSGDRHRSSRGAFPSDFPQGAADLVRALLHPEPTQRLGGGSGGLAEVFQHPWLAPLGDVNTLHSRVGPTVPPLLLSTHAALHATTSKSWMRRHASSLWAPTHRVAPLPVALPKGTQEGERSGGEVRLPLKTLLACESLPPLF